MSLFWTKTCFGSVSTPELVIYIEQWMPPHSDWHNPELVRHTHYLCFIIWSVCYLHHYLIYWSIKYNRLSCISDIQLYTQLTLIIIACFLFLMLSRNEAHHTHPGSLWQLITRILQPSKNNQLPVPSRYKIRVSVVGLVLLLIFF